MLYPPPLFYLLPEHTIYIVLSKDRRQFVSAVFSKRKSLDEFKLNLPEAERNNVTLLDVDCRYPFYIAENHEGFSYHSEADVRLLLIGYVKEILSHNDDWCYTNLYRVSEDFIPKNP